MLCYFYPAARKIILRVVDFIQTTPALALLGIIMITPLGAGKPTVIVGLALYSLLPIVRNTCLGLDQVPAYLIEAGKGMGMTRRYRLLHVEMPLAAPIIFTGIRIATVNAIGTAVFASFVGGGGLGSYLTTAIRQRGHGHHPHRHRGAHGDGPGAGPAHGPDGAVSQQPHQPPLPRPSGRCPGGRRAVLSGCGGAVRVRLPPRQQQRPDPLPGRIFRGAAGQQHDQAAGGGPAPRPDRDHQGPDDRQEQLHRAHPAKGTPAT